MRAWGAQDTLDHSGRSWTTSIRWLPRRPRWLGWGFKRNRDEDRTSVGDWLSVVNVPIGDDPISGVIGIVVVAVVVVVLLILCWLLVFPVLVFALDVLLVVFLAVGAVATRVLFRRPWIVTAGRDDGTVYEWPVVGWKAARRAVHGISARLHQGVPAEDALPGARGIVRPRDRQHS